MAVAAHMDMDTVSALFGSSISAMADQYATSATTPATWRDQLDIPFLFLCDGATDHENTDARFSYPGNPMGRFKWGSGILNIITMIHDVDPSSS